ncbi:MAG: flavodoxin domain-containing protein, partial [Candidatus Margulisiibacteriota bacterium]
RSHISEMVEAYKKWSANAIEKKAVIVYDTMWHSTEKIAKAVYNAFKAKQYDVVMYNLQHIHISDVMTDVLDAEYVCVGSPTLNNNMMPPVSAFLTYMKGLAPKNRKGMAFGSYGWGGQSVGQIEDILKESGFEMLDQIRMQYIPDPIELGENVEKVLMVV